MSFQFATCQWEPYGRSFVQQMYPSKVVKDESIPKLIDLIKKDVLRVQDPNFHQPCQIVAGTNYVGQEHDALISEAIHEFKRNLHDAPDQPK